MDGHLRDIIRRCERSGGPCFTRFLDPAAAEAFQSAVRGAGLEGGRFGGAPDAQRAVQGCWRPGFEPDQWPVAALMASWDKLSAGPTHRDLLGALLGLGIERDCIGDIRVGDSRAWFAAQQGVAPFILDQFVQAGRTSLRVEWAQQTLPAPKPQARNVNVASLRLDAVLAAALNLSRGRAQELIRSGKVFFNWKEELRPDREVATGDTLSIRGKGRVVVGELTGVSRKGRLYAGIETFFDQDRS